MMGNKDALDYLECSIPDMLGEITEETAAEYEKFADRVRYLIHKDRGVIPKYHKGHSIHDYWTCGNCGGQILEVHYKYCPNCGYSLTLQFPNHSNPKEGE